MSPHAATSRMDRNSAIDTGLVDRCGDDDADPDGHRADEHSEGEVLLLDDLLPQVIRRHLVDDDERRDEHRDADDREHQGCLDVVNDIHHFPPVKRRKPPYTGRYDPGLSRTDLGTVRASLNDVSRQPRNSAVPIRPTTTSPYRRYNVVIIAFRPQMAPLTRDRFPATGDARTSPRAAMPGSAARQSAPARP